MTVEMPAYSTGRGLRALSHFRDESRARIYKPTPMGYYIPDGAERMVTVTRVSTGATMKAEHALLVLLIGGVMDGWMDERNDSDQYLILDNALDLILSDMDTGSSLNDWPSARRIVERALTIALDGDVVTTEWAAF